MPRFFDQTDDVIKMPVGGIGTLTALSIAAIVRLNSENNSAKYVFHTGAGANPRFGLRISGTELVQLDVNNTARSSTTTVVIADGWAFIAVTKAAGTSTGRAHIYKYAAAGSFVHENLSSTNVDPGGTPATGSTIGASNFTTPANFFAGDIAIVGVFGENLSDAAVENLAFSLQAWYRPLTVGLWLLDQSDVAYNVADLTGGGANQSAITGTTVTADALPVFTYGHWPLLVERTYAAAPPSGTGALTLPSIAVSGTGVMHPSATGALTLPTVAVSGTGAETFSATGALTMPPVAVSGTGTAAFEATGALTLPTIAVAGTGVMHPDGTGALTLPSAAVAGTGAESFDATGALTLPVVTLDGTGLMHPSGTGALTLPSIAVTGTGAETLSATGALTLPAISVAGEGAHTEGGGPPVTGTGTLTLPAALVAGTGLVFTPGAEFREAVWTPWLAHITGAGELRLPMVTVAGDGFVDDALTLLEVGLI